MKREDAEKLLAASILGDLDQATQAELEALLATDESLRERLVDLRMALKVTRDALHQDPEPVLSTERLAQLEALTQRPTKVGHRLLLTKIAAVLLVLFFIGILVLPQLQRAQLVPEMATMDQMKAPPSSQTWEEGESATRFQARSEVKRPAVQNAPQAAPTEGLDMAGGTSLVYEDSLAMSESSVRKDNLSTRPGVPTNALGVGGNGKTDLSNSDLYASNIVASKPEGLEREQNADARYTTDRYGGDLALAQPLINGEETDIPDSQLAMAADRKDSRLDVITEFGSVAVDGPLDFSEELSRGARAMPTNTTSSAKYAYNEPYAWGRTVSPTQQEKFDYDYDGKMTSYNSNGVVGVDLESPQKALQESLDGDIVVMGTDRALDEVDGIKKEIPLLGDTPVVRTPLERESKTLLTSHEVVTPAQPESVIVEDDSFLPPASRFQTVPVNPWVLTEQDALSTFGLDVDTASYTLCRRYLRGGFLPPVGAVRMEEFVNALDYHYPQRSDAAFAIVAEAAPAPMASANQNLTLLKVAVKARTLGRDQRKAAHLVWVVDASASMGQADRLPLVQQALHDLTDRLDPRDRVSLVTCDREARLVLETVSAQQAEQIHAAIDAIQPTGSTHLVAGLKLGYALARREFAAGCVNHVLLCSDGIANIGATAAEEILQEVAADRVQGITTTCVGVGFGAYNDALLEPLANRADGSYCFLDASEVSRQALVESLTASMQAMALDARIQVAFDPTRVRRYRLIGYENRDIADDRFRDDTVDAGQIGSGQCSTALYELELMGSPLEQPVLGQVTVRYRDAETGQMAEIARDLNQDLVRARTIESSPGFYLAVSAARFAEWLRQSPHARDLDYDELKDTIDQVQQVLSLDAKVKDLQNLIHQAEGLPRAP